MTSTEPDELDPHRGPLLRSTVMALGGSTILLVIAGAMALFWVWATFRYQQHLGPQGSPFGDESGQPGPSMFDRIDALQYSIALLGQAGLVAGAGLGLRLIADTTAARLGVAAPEPSIGPDTV